MKEVPLGLTTYDVPEPPRLLLNFFFLLAVTANFVVGWGEGQIGMIFSHVHTRISTHFRSHRIFTSEIKALRYP